MSNSDVPESPEKVIYEVKLQESGSWSSTLPLSGGHTPLSEPYVHFVLTKSHVKPVYQMVFPVRLYPHLPSTTGPEMRLPATIVCHGETWEAIFFANSKIKKLVSGWRAFVEDNELKRGDAIFWELKESSNEKVRFNVQFIRGDFPAELEARANGDTVDTAFVID